MPWKAIYPVLRKLAGEFLNLRMHRRRPIGVAIHLNRGIDVPPPVFTCRDIHLRLIDLFIVHVPCHAASCMMY